MPKYKNRPPMDGNMELRHYTTLEALVQIFRSGQLRLTRVDKFKDPFEGSVPKKQIDDQVLLFSSRNRGTTGVMRPHRHHMSDPWEEWKLRRRAKTRSSHARKSLKNE